MELFLICYFLCINLAAFLLFGMDKRRARQNRWRISEKALFLSALLGGTPGAILGMQVFHHKTLHRRFRYGLPVILFIQLFLICLWFVFPLP